MTQYKRRTSTSRKTKQSSADWQGLAYYSIIGVLAYVAFMAIRSLSLGSGNKSSFFDWLKSIFNIMEAGLGGSGSSGSGSGSSPDVSGFESDAENSSGSSSGTDLYSSAISDYKYFKASEYFGNYPRPTDPTLITNYNNLMRDLDLIRENFGSAVKIVTGYKGSELAIFQQCKGVHIVALNGSNLSLNKVVVALRNSKQISGVSVYYPDNGNTRYYLK